MRVLIVALVAAGSLATASASDVSTLAAVFSVLPPGWTAADGYAVSWRYRPDARGWAASMPRNGIAVTVIDVGRPRVGSRPLRPRLPAKPFTTLEGAPDTPEYRIAGRVRGRDVEIRVDIRRPRPTAPQRRMAQRVVSGIRFVADP